MSCECVALESFLAGGMVGQKCSNSQFTMAWSAHIFINFVPILKLTVIMSPSKALYNTTENVLFKLSVNANDSPIKFVVDFNDNTALETTDQVVGHSWTKVGTFKVNITAVGYYASHSVISTVNVKMISTGKPPDPVVFQTWSDNNDPAVGKVSYKLNAFSVEKKTCLLTLSRKEILNFEENSKLVLEETSDYVYGSAGFYNTSLMSSNKFGAHTSSRILVARVFQTSTKKLKYTDQGSVDVNVENFQNNGKLYLDSEMIASNRYRITPNAVSLGMKQLKRGSHFLLLTSKEEKAVVKEVIDIIRPVGKISIAATDFHSKINKEMHFTVDVTQGDQLFVKFSCGNGESTFHFISFAAKAVSLKTSCSYTQLGKYQLSVVAANEVSQAEVEQEVSIEREVSTATLRVFNTIQLGTPTEFVFTVDQNKLPASTVNLEIAYGNGVMDNVELHPVNQATPLYKHTYVYPQYGTYTVKSRIFNSLSSVTLEPAKLQVGQNVTSVDMYVEESNVRAGESITLNVKCPTGSPVVMEVDMGDGKVVKLYRPTNYKAEDNYNLRNPPVTEKKTAISERPDYLNDFVVKYTYNNSGMYAVKVKVENIFSSTQSTLCPNINVVAPADDNLRCNSLSVSVMNASSFDTPLIATRSNEVNLQASSQLQCGRNRPTALYVWQAEKYVGSFWKPERQVCESGSFKNDFTIPSNTLWYGIYRLNVSVVAVQFGVSTTSHSSMMSIFLKVVSSPLVAEITSDKNNFYSNFDLVRLNLSTSHDPDVKAGNLTGMRFVVVCSRAEGHDQLTSQQVEMEGTVITENTQINAYMYQFDADRCFKEKPSIDFNKDLTVGFLASEVQTSEAIKFTLFVSKDERESSAVVQFSVLMTNLSASPLDSIDDLLKNGNTGAALQILDLVTTSLTPSGNDSEVTEEVLT